MCIAQVPRYTVLYDENDLALECLQRMVYWLCHGNQVVAQATSLPAPVCIANEYVRICEPLIDALSGMPSAAVTSTSR